MPERSSLVLLWILFCLVAYGCWRLLAIYRLKWKVEALGLPTIKGWPLLGNVMEFGKFFGRKPGVPFNVYSMEVLSGFRQALQQHSLFYGLMGPVPYLIFSRAKDVEALLSHPREVNKSDEYVFLHDWLGMGLLTSSYGKWKSDRKKLTPPFHFKTLDGFQSVFSDQSDVLVQKLRCQVDKPFIHIDKFLNNCTLDIITQTALGVNINAQKGDSSSYVQALHSLGLNIFIRFCQPWLWPEPLFRLSPVGRQSDRSLKVIKNFIKTIIKEKKQSMLDTDDQNVCDAEDEDKVRPRRAFLEMMLTQQNSGQSIFTDQDIEDQVNTISFAGQDTTSTGMMWTLYLLGLYTEVQDKVHRELDQVFEKEVQRSITKEDIKKMPYLERVIKESQRLYPSVPIIARKLDRDLLIDGVSIPRGVSCGVVTYILHRDPEVFPNPEVFDPDRFLETNRHPFAFVPFSAGPRNCIGQRFAMSEMKTILSNVLRTLRVRSLDTRDKVLFCTDIVSKPSEPVRIQILLREGDTFFHPHHF